MFNLNDFVILNIPLDFTTLIYNIIENVVIFKIIKLLVFYFSLYIFYKNYFIGLFATGFFIYGINNIALNTSRFFYHFTKKMLYLYFSFIFFSFLSFIINF